MNCREIQNLLHAYNDGELDAARSLEIEQHLHACPECRQVQRNQATLKTAIAGNAPYFKAPADLRRNILHSINEKSQTEKESTPSRAWLWSTPKAALAMAACLMAGFFGALFLTPLLQRGSSDQLVVNELAASHVRSLLADHLLDVVSTDQHTVKPWFDGKLDFAPPVNDLAAKGYPLIGGRLDYIGDRTVAVLIYKKQKHIINLYIWPTGKSSDSLHTATKDGYNLTCWYHAGMNFWAVSDVNAADLQDFAKLITDEAK